MKKNELSQKIRSCYGIYYLNPVVKKIFLLLFTFLALSFQVLFAQTRTISGLINDENGNALQGVNVVAKGSSTGVTTATDGKYSIELADKIKKCLCCTHQW